MRILLYSTSSNIFEPKTAVVKNFPSSAQQLELLAKSFPEHSFIVATQLPGMFLLDMNGSEKFQKANDVQYEIIKSDDEAEIADFLYSQLSTLACLKKSLRPHARNIRTIEKSLMT